MFERRARAALSPEMPRALADVLRIRLGLLRLHAGWLGGRWARRAGARITAEVGRQIADDLLVPLEQFDASRAALRKALIAADDCS